MTFLQAIRTLWTMGRGVRAGLPDAHDTDDPIELFGRWFRDAEQSGLVLPEAMTLATATRDGRPSARMVLLKGHGQEGFTFFTNYDSRKGSELEDNPTAALVFHWGILQRQVRIEGDIVRLEKAESEKYFHSRARGSQIGAVASRQSAILEQRADLEQRVAELEEEFQGMEVPLPPFWGGFRLRPRSIEFWQGRMNRLHDRLLFERDGEGWSPRRLYP